MAETDIIRTRRELRQALWDLSFESRYLAQLALQANLNTGWQADGGGGKNLDSLLHQQGFYEKDGINDLLVHISRTELRRTSKVVCAAIALFVAYGNPKTNLPDRLKVHILPCTLYKPLKLSDEHA